jgi:uncharacterized membrane protein (DUF4010 family)
MMNEQEILTRLAVALAAGFLVGVERGWRERDAGEGQRVAGLRTFALIGLAGGIFGLLGKELGQAAFAAGFLAVAAAVGAYRWREAAHEGGFGVTTVVAAFLTFAIGAYAAIGSMAAAAAAAVAATAILAAKGWLHEWLKTLTWEELRAALILAAMSFLALPVLPDRGFGPYAAFNPHELWLMTIAIAGVSFIGYVAVKVAGARYGPLIAGVTGGVVSSTITTLDLARRAKASPASQRPLLAGALAASATMFARVSLVVALFGPLLFAQIIGPLAAALLVSVLAAVAIDVLWPGRRAVPSGEAAPLKNPFDLKTVLLFGLLLAIVVFLSASLTAMFGGNGGIILAAVAGISDVDAITLSMTHVAGTSISLSAAEAAILTAVSVNSLSKSVLALIAGGRWFGLRYLGVSVASLAAGGAVAFFEPWSL